MKKARQSRAKINAYPSAKRNKDVKKSHVPSTTINLFPVDETNTTRSKLDGSYSKNNTIFC